MAEVSVTHSYDVPSEKLFEIATDMRRWEEWNTLFTKWKSEPPASIAVGTEVTAVMTIMGMANTITLTVDEYEPPKRLVLSGTGMAGAKVTLTMEASESNGTTSFTADAGFVSQMMVGAIGGAVERAAKKELEASLEKLGPLLSA